MLSWHKSRGVPRCPKPGGFSVFSTVSMAPNGGFSLPRCCALMLQLASQHARAAAAAGAGECVRMPCKKYLMNDCFSFFQFFSLIMIVIVMITSDTSDASTW